MHESAGRNFRVAKGAERNARKRMEEIGPFVMFCPSI